jgi:hypothetical protein
MEYGSHAAEYLDGEIEVSEPRDDGYTALIGSRGGLVFVPTSKLPELIRLLEERLRT